MTLLKKLFSERFNFVFNAFFAILTLAIPIILYRFIFLTTFLLSIVAIVGLYRWKSFTSSFIFIFGLLFGVTSEIIAIHFGVWEYRFTNFFNVPLWLFIVWGNSAVFIYQTALEFTKITGKK